MLADFAIALGFILVACLAMALPAAWMQRRHGAEQPSDTRDLARDVAQRLGVMHGLILGLVFGQVLGDASQLRDSIRAEAAAVEHVYHRAAEYGAPGVQRAATDYLDAVVRHDWPDLARGNRLSREGWRAWRALSAQALALRPADRTQQVLADAMQQAVWRIEGMRQARGFHAGMRLPYEFWFAAITGLMLIGAVFFIHAPTRKHLAIAAAYSTYTGIVLYMIFDLSHPFGGFVTMSPEAFEQSLALLRARP